MQAFQDFGRTYIIIRNGNEYRVKQYNQNSVLVGEMTTGREWLDMMGFEYTEAEKTLTVNSEELNKGCGWISTFKAGDVVSVARETKCYYIFNELFINKYSGKVFASPRYISKKHGTMKGVPEKYRDWSLSFFTDF